MKTISLICSHCSKKFEKPKSTFQRTKANRRRNGRSTDEWFCSPDCSTNHRKTIQTVRCAFCDEEIQKRPCDLSRVKLPFCDQSCSAKYYNPLTAIRRHCLDCNAPLKRQQKDRCFECLKLYKAKIMMDRFTRGDVHDRVTLRKLLIKTVGYTCAECTIQDWNQKPITLQIDHIDGNAENNLPKNLQFLCPNCHSQTDTWGGRNKGSGRRSRGLSPSY